MGSNKYLCNLKKNIPPPTPTPNTPVMVWGFDLYPQEKKIKGLFYFSKLKNLVISLADKESTFRVVTPARTLRDVPKIFVIHINYF